MRASRPQVRIEMLRIKIKHFMHKLRILLGTTLLDYQIPYDATNIIFHAELFMTSIEGGWGRIAHR